jgi:hypothetical protein
MSCRLGSLVCFRHPYERLRQAVLKQRAEDKGSQGAWVKDQILVFGCLSQVSADLHSSHSWAPVPTSLDL